MLSPPACHPPLAVVVAFAAVASPSVCQAVAAAAALRTCEELEAMSVAEPIDARKRFDACLADLERLDGLPPDLWVRLGVVADHVGAPAAVRLLARGVDGLVHQVGPEHASTLAARLHCTAARHVTGDDGNAERDWRDLLATTSRVLGERDPLTLVVTGNLGVALAGLGRYAEAKELHERCLAGLQDRAEPREGSIVSETLNLAVALDGIGERERANTIGAAAWTRAQSLFAHDPVRLAGSALVWLQLVQDRPETFAEFARATAAARATLPEDHPYLLSLRDCALDTLAAHDLFAAWREGTDLLALWRRSQPDSLRLGLLHLRVAKLARDIGDLRSAYDELRAGWAILEATGWRHEALKSSLPGAAEIWAEVGQPARALDALAAYVADDAGFDGARPAQQTLLLAYGRALQSAGRLDEAERFFARLLDSAAPVAPADRRARGMAWGLRANNALARGLPAEATAAAARGLGELGDTDAALQDVRASLSSVLGCAEMQLGEFESALVHLAVESPEGTAHPTGIRHCTNRALAAFHGGDHERARAEALAAIGVLVAIRARVGLQLGEGSRHSLERECEAARDILLSLPSDIVDDRTAAQAVLRLREGSRVACEIAARYRARRREDPGLERLRAAADAAWLQLRAAGTNADAALEHAADDAEQQLRRALFGDGEHGFGTVTETLPPTGTQAIVSVEYARQTPWDAAARRVPPAKLNSAIFVIASDGATRRLEVPAGQQMRDITAAYVAGLRQMSSGTRGRDPETGTQYAFADTLATLAHYLRPVRDALDPDVATVFASLDGSWATFPWDASVGDGVMGDRWQFVVVDGLPAAWVPAPLPPMGPGDVLLVGDVDFGKGAIADWKALAGTAHEVDAIVHLHDELGSDRPARVLRGDDATRAALLAAAPHAKIMHVATHGYVDARLADGLATVRLTWQELGQVCGLVLARANEEPVAASCVTAAELGRIDLLDCELAVLSACGTNLGPRSAGEAVAGLNRGLHLAGARLSVASLWAVADVPTALFFEEFYRALWHDHATVPGALSAAREASKRAGYGAGVWAAFQLYANAGRR
ncbi:MAG TPA: CHAT domain-containing tetratricopeptide repeat protein [Planctomycetota bacterium]|nr:CHAT domain-containing tetratricopeptide repeat protein [Planctomycetota bacterium]